MRRWHTCCTVQLIWPATLCRAAPVKAERSLRSSGNIALHDQARLHASSMAASAQTRLTGSHAVACWERQGRLRYDVLLQAQSALSHGVLGCSCPMRESCESAHAPRIPQRLVVCCTALQSSQSLAIASRLLGTSPEEEGALLHKRVQISWCPR